MILGTGGASKAVYHGLKNLGIESIFVSRTHKADDMLTYEELTPRNYGRIYNHRQLYSRRYVS